MARDFGARAIGGGLMRLRCSNCSAEFEAVDAAAMADVLLEHCEMHELEVVTPKLLEFILLPAEAFFLEVELRQR